ncbi:MAG TPA: tetratricopeptide repeat protein [Verrucomicrobiota bacterium]|nr:tetratricopeptide repeat protein [Verrucomicrobiota bacterium]
MNSRDRAARSRVAVGFTLVSMIVVSSQARQALTPRYPMAGAAAYERYRSERAASTNQPIDPTAAARVTKYLRIAAELEYPPAMFDYALQFSRPDGTNAPNLTEAARWYERAASNGVPEAAYNRALLILQPEGARREPESAVRWLEMAATNGLASAQFLLGELYAQGDGVTFNQDAAAYWFHAAAQNGIPEAVYRCSVLIRSGQLAPNPGEDADAMLRLAAESGVAEAQESLANALLLSAAANADAEATRWFLAAASRGLPMAQWKVGHRLLKGEGVVTNAVEGAAWMVVAVEFINPDAQRELLDLQREWPKTTWEKVRLRSGELRQEVQAITAAQRERQPTEAKLGSAVPAPSLVNPTRPTKPRLADSAPIAKADKARLGLPPEPYLERLYSELRERVDKFAKEPGSKRLFTLPFDECREVVTFRLHSDGNVSQIAFQPGGTGGEFAKLLETALGIAPFAVWTEATRRAVGAEEVDLVLTYPKPDRR